MMKKSTGSSFSARLVLCVLSLLALASCGGSGGAAPAEPRSAVLAASQPGELLAYLKLKLQQRAALRQANPSIQFDGGAPDLVVDVDFSAAPAPVLHSGTTVQEAGIDEEDLIKTDGALIFTLDTSEFTSDGLATASLTSYRRLENGATEPAGTLNFPVEENSYPLVHGLLYSESARRVAVLGESVSFFGGGPCAALDGCLGGPEILPPDMIESNQVQIQLVDAATDGALAERNRISISGRLVGARLAGDRLYVVTSHVPSLAFEFLPPQATEAERNAALEAIQVSDVLPVVHFNDAPAQPLLSDTDCYVQASNASPGIAITTMSVFDLANPDAAPVSRCMAGGTEAIYMSQSSLVFATTRYSYVDSGSDDLVNPAEIFTDLHKFALNDGTPVYRGSGAVPGHLGWDAARKPYRISEHDGDLRVITFTGESGWATAADAGQLPASPATLTILRENPGEMTLESIAQLPNLNRPQALGKPGEQIYAVRFLGDRAYIVTFRQTDPLYVLDLSDPLDPRVAGELEAPGFSDHLFSLADGLLFGVGRDADANGVQGGIKVALFDVRNPAQPTVAAERIFGVPGSSTALDNSPHGLNWLTEGAQVRLALPMQVMTDTGEWQQGLQRIEVDTGSLAMTVKPIILSAESALGYGVWNERSLQIGAQIYYLSGGELGTWDW